MTTQETITSTTLVPREEGKYSGLFGRGKFGFFVFGLAEDNANIQNLLGTGTTAQESTTSTSGSTAQETRTSVDA